MLRAFAAMALLSAFPAAQCPTLLVPLSPGANGEVNTIERLANGDTIVAGAFTSLMGVPANSIARWHGPTITPLGVGLNGPVRAVLELPNGDLIVGGSFTSAGGVPAANVARWSGSAWSPIGAGVPGEVWSLAARPNGELYAGGVYVDRLLRWNGTAWSGVGLAPFFLGLSPVTALHVLPNGDLIASGMVLISALSTWFDFGRWDGTTWTPMPGIGGAGNSGNAARFVTLRNGDLIACGAFTGICLARLVGNSWNLLGYASAPFGGVHALTELPDGDLVAGGNFFYIGANINARGFARFDGAAWQVLTTGTPYPEVHALLSLPSGEVLVGGNIPNVNGQPANHLALLVPTCPASANPSGSGCVGAGGLLTLAPLSLPYVGSQQRSRASGLPANAFAVGLLGRSALAIPLSSLLPQGLAGCSLLASPEQLSLHVPSAGDVDVELSVPNATVLVGQVLHQQVASVELGAFGAITGIATTNALVLTIGAF